MPGFTRIIAADSMGVRSLATFIDICGVTVGVDLGAALAPRRYGLPPHPLEYKRLGDALEKAKKFIAESDIIIVTHYHYDHYIREDPSLYHGKTLIAKSIDRGINWSQKLRGYRFLKKSGLIDKARVIEGDGSKHVFDKLLVELSKPVWHGEPGSKVGKVLMARILCEDYSIIFTSDVQGPADPEALLTLREWASPRPALVILGGPPTYSSGILVSEEAVEKGLAGLKTVIRDVKPEILVVDHHLLRDIDYMRYIEEHARTASELQVRLFTAAEYEGKPLEQLEARRRELWRRERRDDD